MKTLFTLLTIIVAMVVITSCSTGNATETNTCPHACDSIIVLRAQNMIDNTISPIYVLKKNLSTFKADDLVWVNSTNQFIQTPNEIIDEEVVMYNKFIKYRILIQ